MTPSIGRIVHYFAPGREFGPPQAAIVTATGDGGMFHEFSPLNLIVFPDMGFPAPMLSVPRRSYTGGNGWDWPEQVA